jgi:hypothetical protein
VYVAREYQTCEWSSLCQTIANSCVIISEAASQRSPLWKDVTITPWENRREEHDKGGNQLLDQIFKYLKNANHSLKTLAVPCTVLRSAHHYFVGLAICSKLFWEGFSTGPAYL